MGLGVVWVVGVWVVAAVVAVMGTVRRLVWLPVLTRVPVLTRPFSRLI
jgi:hypothetical protein